MNQHYVPRVYLKNFSVQRNKDFYIDVFSKSTRKYFNTNIKNVCAEKDLYTLSENSKLSDNSLYLEKYFSEVIEPQYQKCYDILTNDDIYQINDIERYDILIGLLQLFTRNPILLRKALKTQRKIISNIVKKANALGSKFFKFRAKEYDLSNNSVEEVMSIIGKEQLLQFKEQNIRSMSELGSFHKNAIIQVNKIRDDSVFFTCDFPVPFIDGLYEDRNPFMKSKEFYIPLNKKYCVKIYHDKFKNKNSVYRTEVPNGPPYELNQKIFSQSSRFIFGSKEDINTFFNMKSFIDSKETDLDTIMDIIGKVLELGPNPNEPAPNDKIFERLKVFFDLYKIEWYYNN